MKSYLLVPLWGGLILGGQLEASAQATGHGLRGDYYAGLNFEHLIQTRRDPLVDFTWRFDQPIIFVHYES